VNADDPDVEAWFTDLHHPQEDAEVGARASELTKIVAAWCASWS
jgi:hypothetical protein